MELNPLASVTYTKLLLVFAVFEAVLYRFFFFFQAEDGIRVRDVTGVQTCALPILRAFWKSQLWTDSANFYKELKGESDGESTTIDYNYMNEETSFDAISAYYKFVLLNPLKINLKWRVSGTPNWMEYRLIQMWEASCKMAANSSKFIEIADKLNNDLYTQKEFKQLVSQPENTITISNLNLSKEWSTVKNDPTQMAAVYVMLRFLDYDKTDI